ncbi:hypothetical protein PEC106568_36800 [Pectobacterium carotovorum subsp. carotovorum]|nr:hypothetical protein PEC106568_36800 [Pectobacterium carotovorum subsp. carotovorum]
MQFHTPYACRIKKSLVREKSSQKIPGISDNEIIIWLINYTELKPNNPYIFSTWRAILIIGFSLTVLPNMSSAYGQIYLTRPNARTITSNPIDPLRHQVM